MLTGDNTGVCRFVVLILLSTLAGLAENWPQFRGPHGDGHSSETNLPLTWKESENVAWKMPLPGKGWSSPVIVDKEIWLTTATEGDRSLRVLAIDAEGGKILQNVEVFRLASAVSGHAKNSAASPSVIVDGDRVYVHFGSYGTACLRRNGAVVWRTQELKYSQVHGPGGSPILYENLLILNCDGNSTQFVVALDKNTGKIVWQKDRPSAMAYATPLIIRPASGPQLVSPGAFRAISYNPATGEELWFVSMETDSLTFHARCSDTGWCISVRAFINRICSRCELMEKVTSPQVICSGKQLEVRHSHLRRCLLAMKYIW